jgi:hypothetical protein
MSKITHIKGDLFEHIPSRYDRDSNIVIPHICNTIGSWGSGFVLPLAKAYPISRTVYFAKHNEFGLNLGEVQIPLVDDGVYVANMIAQNGISSGRTGDISRVNSKPIRYAALCQCLNKVNMLFEDCDVYAPKFGSGLAGGNWEFIEELIDEILVDVRDIYIFSL